jgi:hypothetical protein
MAKMILKSVFCFAMVALWSIGLGSISSENWYICVPMIFGSLFAFGCACVNGWLNELMDFVEGCEKRMLG